MEHTKDDPTTASTALHRRVGGRVPQWLRSWERPPRPSCMLPARAAQHMEHTATKSRWTRTTWTIHGSNRFTGSPTIIVRWRGLRLQYRPHGGRVHNSTMQQTSQTHASPHVHTMHHLLECSRCSPLVCMLQCEFREATVGEPHRRASSQPASP